MGDHTHTTRATALPLPPQLRLCGLMLLFLISFWLMAALPAAQAADLEYNQSFEGEDETFTLDGWRASNLTGESSFISHYIKDNALRIVSRGTADLNSYYGLFLDNTISDNFTSIIQISYITDNGLETRAGLVLTDPSTKKVLLQVAVIPNVGFRMITDKDGDGSEDALPPVNTVSIIPNPPGVWLKLVKNVDQYTGYYGTNGGDWFEIGTVELSTAPVDMGLFAKSGASATSADPNTCDFDNFGLVSATTTYLLYEDYDGDGYGNPWSTHISTSNSSTGTYVDNNTDCDDTDANTHPQDPDDPDSIEVCDGKDNDCDGTIDEEFNTTIYYRDADGDLFGTATDTRLGCTKPDGYVATPGDCNDNDPSRNPAAYDIYDNGIDEDCAGGDAISAPDTNCDLISDTPLSVTTGGSSAIVMFLLDDSGNMMNSVLCPENDGLFGGSPDYNHNETVKLEWKSQYHGYNRIYYNPGTTYNPWPDSTLYKFTDTVADFNNARIHPMSFYFPYDFECIALKHVNEEKDNTTHLDLTTSFTTIGKENKDNKTTITFGHYYVQSTTDDQVYLVDLGISDPSNPDNPKYYRVTDYADKLQETVAAIESTSPPADVAIPQANLAAARQNFVNWFTYHRTRETMSKAALAWALQKVSDIKVGLHTVLSSHPDSLYDYSVPATLISADADVQNFLDSVYKVAPKNNEKKPLEKALEDVGKYFDANDTEGDGIGPNPFDSAEDGGNCQQAFAILMTSGYGSGATPSVGNADGGNDGNGDTNYDGGEFADSKPNTLADVAMYYYERDLANELEDNVPVQDPIYEAPHQRMVTYAVSFGIEGNYIRNDYPDCPPSAPGNTINCPDWAENNNKDARVDELWHAAVNGRGKYINTNSPQELSDAINTVLNDITRRVGTAASVAVSSEKLDTGLVIYQGYFNSGDWSGNLEAYNVNSDGELTLTENADGEATITPLWSTKTQLASIGYDNRKILTKKDSTGNTIAFRYDDISENQQKFLSRDQLNYIRGDTSKEVGQGGAFRNRSSKLGDITHSSPILHKGVVYVGANDGMFHAFNATNGNELFAYVPSFVYPNLAEYTSPYYGHKFYADGTATARTVDGADWVVSGLRKGGQGFFGINVTSSEDALPSISETQPPSIWEYPAPNATPKDPDVGFTYGEVTIARGNTGDQLIFAANGYNSPRGNAVLLVLKLDGTLFTKIDTHVGMSGESNEVESSLDTGNCNGLSDPLVVDLNDDGKADVVYAGDLLGNLWKFDISSTTKGEWGVAYQTGGENKPLFTARNSSGEIQPITSKPAAMFHCDSTRKGTIVVFGTGRMLSKTDLDNTNVQTVYGIWDWQAEWTHYKIDDNGSDYHMGTFNAANETSSVRTLDNIEGNGLFPHNMNLTLLQQSKVDSETPSALWRDTSNNAIDWFDIKKWTETTGDGTYSGGIHVGWYLNLPATKERVITKTQIRDGKAYIVSIIPEPAPCASGGTTVGTIISACNGGQLDDPQWDTDGQNGVDANDDNSSGKIFDDDIYYAPAIIEDKLFFTKDRIEDTTNETKGLYYWYIKE